MLMLMENTRTTLIATPAQRQALIRNQHQRLRDQAEALLCAAEAIETLVEHEQLAAWKAIHDRSLEVLAQARQLKRMKTPRALDRV